MSILANLDKSRKELLDLGLRNSLINHRNRTKQIRIIDELSTETFRILVQEEKKMSFHPLQKDDKRLEDPEIIEAEQTQLKLLIDNFENNGSDEKTLDKKYIDNKLQTAYDQQGLQKKLLSIHNDSRTYIEEQGVNILYLALGFLHWYESESSDELRKAPLVLIPVELTRSDVQERFSVNYSGGEISDNLSLQEKLKQEFNIRLPSLGNIEELNLNEYYKNVSKVIGRIDRWSIDQNEITLGFFSFGKFLMYKDLESEHWPEGNGPEENSILCALLENGFEPKEPLHNDETNLDSIIAPADLHLVMDADSSQLQTILEINEGRNLVIQGPPGTGKSQTITNIIAEAIGQDKKVLFVSEKMAALEVVKRRLDQVHLGDCALELHSYKTNKKVLLEEINRTLNLGKPSKSDKSGNNVSHLVKHRDKLNEYATAVNTPFENTSTNFVTAVGKAQLIKTTIPNPYEFKFKYMSKWAFDDYKDKRLFVERLDYHINTIGNPKSHPFVGSQLKDFLPSEKNEILLVVEECKKRLSKLIDKCNVISTKIGIQSIKNFNEVQLLLTSARVINNAPSNINYLNLISTKWREDPLAFLESRKVLFELEQNYGSEWEFKDLMTADLDLLKDKITSYKHKWFRFFINDFLKAKKEILSYYKEKKYKNGNKGLEDLLTAVIEGKRQLNIEKQLSSNYKELFAQNIDDEDLNWAEIYNTGVWIREVYEDINNGNLYKEVLQFLQSNYGFNFKENSISDIEKALNKYDKSIEKISKKLDLKRDNDEISFNDFGMDFHYHTTRFDNWTEQIDRLSEWVTFNQIIEELENEGLGFIVQAVYDWPYNEGYLTASYDYSWYYGIAVKAYKNTPAIKKFSRSEHELTAKKFIDLDKEVLFYNQLRLALKHFEQIPLLSQGGGQLSIIQKEIHKKRRHLPIRELIKQTGEVLQVIKPVFMMSPMSIATYIPPGVLEFDLIIFDEASQVKPVDAFGALLRGKQAVVVGDDKQLPPTSFFDNLMADDEEDYDYVGDMESILSLFLARGSNSKMLRWHYRSKHASLIAVSNNEFYNNKLFIFPSSGINRKAQGLVLHHLKDTSYDRGKSRTNPKEAEEVAKAVIKHAKENPSLSLGVVSFSVAQRDAIIFHLENQRQKNRECEHFFNLTDNNGNDKKEPFFVKNLENVQGDERDIIIISIGYGKTDEGYFPMSFGPLNREGGERRLNVLISRARLGMHVYSNFTAKDIDLERTNSRGVIALKNFLAYAETRIIDQPYHTEKEPDSPFEEAVLKMLHQHNIEAEPQVGTAGFFIDIGIVNPSNKSEYILGIECDGASYHKTKSARDRDRIRQEVLESLGWKIYRIWSTDWFNNPEAEFKKLLYAIERAKNSLGQNPAYESAQNNNYAEIKLERETNGKQENGELESEINYYKEADMYFNLPYELYEITSDGIAGLIKQVVNIESPIHRDIVIKRVSELCGYGKAGSRLRQAINRGLRFGSSEKMFFLNDNFVWRELSHKLVPRNRSKLKNNERKIDYITSNELCEAIKLIVDRSFTISEPELISLTSQLLGFSRVTDGISKSIQKEIKKLIRKNEIIGANDQLKLAK